MYIYIYIYVAPLVGDLVVLGVDGLVGVLDEVLVLLLRALLVPEGLLLHLHGVADDLLQEPWENEKEERIKGGMIFQAPLF